jgi:hypothetical protein
LNILLKELEKNPIKSFGKKTIEKLNKKIWFFTYYNNNYDLSIFNILYITKDNYWNKNEYCDIYSATPENLIEKIKSSIEYIKKSIENIKKTIKAQKQIQKKINKIIELKKEIWHENFNSSIVELILNNTIDSYYYKR